MARKSRTVIQVNVITPREKKPKINPYAKYGPVWKNFAGGPQKLPQFQRLTGKTLSRRVGPGIRQTSRAIRKTRKFIKATSRTISKIREQRALARSRKIVAQQKKQMAVQTKTNFMKKIKIPSIKSNGLYKPYPGMQADIKAVKTVDKTKP